MASLEVHDKFTGELIQTLTEAEAGDVDAGHAQDLSGFVRDRELLVLEPVSRRALVDERRAGHEREVGIVDLVREVGGVDRRVVRRAAEPVAHVVPSVRLLGAGRDRVLAIRGGLVPARRAPALVGEVVAARQRELVVALGLLATGVRDVLHRLLARIGRGLERALGQRRRREEGQDPQRPAHDATRRNNLGARFRPEFHARRVAG